MAVAYDLEELLADKTMRGPVIRKMGKDTVLFNTILSELRQCPEFDIRKTEAVLLERLSVLMGLPEVASFAYFEQETVLTILRALEPYVRISNQNRHKLIKNSDERLWAIAFLLYMAIDGLDDDAQSALKSRKLRFDSLATREFRSLAKVTMARTQNVVERAVGQAEKELAPKGKKESLHGKELLGIVFGGDFEGAHEIVVRLEQIFQRETLRRPVLAELRETPLSWESLKAKTEAEGNPRPVPATGKLFAEYLSAHLNFKEPFPLTYFLQRTVAGVIACAKEYAQITAEETGRIATDEDLFGRAFLLHAAISSMPKAEKKKVKKVKVPLANLPNTIKSLTPP